MIHAEDPDLTPAIVSSLYNFYSFAHISKYFKYLLACQVLMNQEDPDLVWIWLVLAVGFAHISNTTMGTCGPAALLLLDENL